MRPLSASKIVCCVRVAFRNAFLWVSGFLPAEGSSCRAPTRGVGARGRQGCGSAGAGAGSSGSRLASGSHPSCAAGLRLASVPSKAPCLALRQPRAAERTEQVWVPVTSLSLRGSSLPKAENSASLASRSHCWFYSSPGEGTLWVGGCWGQRGFAKSLNFINFLFFFFFVGPSSVKNKKKGKCEF